MCLVNVFNILKPLLFLCADGPAWLRYRRKVDACQAWDSGSNPDQRNFLTNNT